MSRALPSPLAVARASGEPPRRCPMRARWPVAAGSTALQNCGLATLLINLTIPGSGNTITLKLGKAKIG